MSRKTFVKQWKPYRKQQRTMTKNSINAYRSIGDSNQDEDLAGVEWYGNNPNDDNRPPALPRITNKRITQRVGMFRNAKFSDVVYTSSAVREAVQKNLQKLVAPEEDVEWLRGQEGRLKRNHHGTANKKVSARDTAENDNDRRLRNGRYPTRSSQERYDDEREATGRRQGPSCSGQGGVGSEGEEEAEDISPLAPRAKRSLYDSGYVPIRRQQACNKRAGIRALRGLNNNKDNRQPGTSQVSSHDEQSQARSFNNQQHQNARHNHPQIQAPHVPLTPRYTPSSAGSSHDQFDVDFNSKIDVSNLSGRIVSSLPQLGLRESNDKQYSSVAVRLVADSLRRSDDHTTLNSNHNETKVPFAMLQCPYPRNWRAWLIILRSLMDQTWAIPTDDVDEAEQVNGRRPDAVEDIFDMRAVREQTPELDKIFNKTMELRHFDNIDRRLNASSGVQCDWGNNEYSVLLTPRSPESELVLSSPGRQAIEFNDPELYVAEELNVSNDEPVPQDWGALQRVPGWDSLDMRRGMDATANDSSQIQPRARLVATDRGVRTNRSPTSIAVSPAEQFDLEDIIAVDGTEATPFQWTLPGKNTHRQ